MFCWVVNLKVEFIVGSFLLFQQLKKEIYLLLGVNYVIMKIKFLDLFIEQFFLKAKTKRRSSKNESNVIIETINNICRVHFGSDLQFSDDEVLESFWDNDFLILNQVDENQSKSLTRKGLLVKVEDTYLNVVVRKNQDLILANLKTYPNNWNPETIERIDDLKCDLKKFWLENKHLIED